jgi:hypothetical protein
MSNRDFGDINIRVVSEFLPIAKRSSIMRRTVICFLTSTSILSAFAISVASADLRIIEIESLSEAGALLSDPFCVPSNSWDLGRLPDFGIVGFDGPVGPNGGGPIPQGFISKGFWDSEMNGPNGGSRGAGGTGLVGVGPSAGFVNPSNFVGANFFVDAFGINFGEEKCAFEWQGTSLLGGPGYDLYVDGVFVQSLQNDVRYRLTGKFNRIAFYDPVGGAEGIYGHAQTWVKGIPEPGSASLLGLLALGLVVRRRR